MEWEEGDRPDVFVSVDRRVKLESPGPERVNVDSDGPGFANRSNPTRRVELVIFFGASNKAVEE